MKNILLVFDIDDTITKSESQHQTAFVNAAKDMGVKSIDQDWIKYKHLTDSYIFKYNFENYLKKTFEPSLITEFEEHMMRHLLSLPETAEIPGAQLMLESFKNRPNYAVCFATGSLLEPALTKLNQAGISYKEDIITGSNQLFTREDIVTNSIEQTKRKTGTEAYDHIISFGDGIWDMKTAKNLGLHFVGVRDKNAENFEKNKVKYLINDWNDFNLAEMERIFDLK